VWWCRPRPHRGARDGHAWPAPSSRDPARCCLDRYRPKIGQTAVPAFGACRPRNAETCYLSGFPGDGAYRDRTGDPQLAKLVLLCRFAGVCVAVGNDLGKSHAGGGGFIRSPPDEIQPLSRRHRALSATLREAGFRGRRRSCARAESRSRDGGVQRSSAPRRSPQKLWLPPSRKRRAPWLRRCRSRSRRFTRR
jgi:hypothetical protein